MSITFFGSHNSRMFLGLEGRDIFLLRDYREAWKRKIKYTNFEVIGVGNNGKVFVKADEGIIVYPQEESGEEYIIPAFEKNALNSENSVISKVVVNRSGDQLCVEKQSIKSKLTEKLFSILASSAAKEKGQSIHELVLYDMKSGKQLIFYKFSVDRRTPHAFTWNISPDFRYAIMGEAQKAFKGAETKFSVADVREESIFDQFVLDGLTDWILYVNNFGTYLIDSLQVKDNREVLIGNKEANNYKITIPNIYKVEHLGKNFVTLQSRMEPTIQFKRFDNSIIQEIDLTPLQEMNMDYQLIFNERDDIDFIARKEGNVKVIHTNLQRIAIDAKRWHLMVEQFRIDEEISKRKTTLEKMQKTLQDKKTELKTKELSKTIDQSREARQKRHLELISIKENEITELINAFKAGHVGKYDYVKQRKKLDEELEELKEISLGAKEDKAEFRLPEIFETAGLSKATAPLKAKTQKIPKPITPETAGFEVQDNKTRPLSLQEELQKYIPTVTSSDEVEEDLSGYGIVVNESDWILSKNTFDKKQVSEKPQQSRKLPDRLELEVSNRKKKLEESLKNQKEVKYPEKDYSSENLYPDFITGIEPPPKKDKTRTLEISISPGTSGRKPSSHHIAYEKRTSHSDGYSTEHSSTAPHKEKLEVNDMEIIKINPPSQAMSDSDNQRLLEIRRQIENEIQEAVSKKRQSTKHSDEQKNKYLKMLEELEESFLHGGISEENYIRLKQKYEEKIKIIDEEGKL